MVYDWVYHIKGGYNPWYFATCKLVINQSINQSQYPLKKKKTETIHGFAMFCHQWQSVVLSSVSSIEKMTGKSSSIMNLSKRFPSFLGRYHCTHWMMLPVHFDDELCRFIIKISTSGHDHRCIYAVCFMMFEHVISFDDFLCGFVWWFSQVTLW